MAEPMSANEDNYSLHIAARSGKKEKMLQILDRRPDLIYHQNMRGDNPLHVAAEAGHLSIVELLIAFVQSLPTSKSSGSTKNSTEEIPSKGKSETEIDIPEVGTTPITDITKAIWKTRNHDGNTALHEALRNKHEDVALHLLDVDSEPVKFANNKDESPLYLAAEAGFVRVLDKIIEVGKDPNTLGPNGRTPFHAEGKDPSTLGPNGRTPFHAAVFAKSEESIEVLYGWIPAQINNKDSVGKTALYYATQEDSLEIIRQLLELDASSALISDNKGLSPLLVAVKKGRSASIVAILNACPGSLLLSDINGYRALHLGVRHNTIEKFKTLLSFPKIKALANERDGEGNTPLHLAAQEKKFRHIQALLHSTDVESKAKNSAGRTAFELCPSADGLTKEQQRIRSALDKGRTFYFLRRYLPPSKGRVNEKLLEMYHDKDLSPTINAMSVVAALIATITFAAALQIPGGYKSDGSPTLIQTATLKAFVLTDTIGFCLSMLALCYLVVSSTNDKVSSANINVVVISGHLLLCALLNAMVAFVSGIYVVISIESQLVAILVSVICCSTAFAGNFFIPQISDLFHKMAGF